MMKRMRSWLAQANPVVFVLFAGLAGFCAYFSMYAFRKPFTAATFDVVPGWDFALDYKIALVIAQVAGYALSKLIGVKVIAEMRAERRALAIVLLIGASWLALVLFAVTPAPWNVAALFLNGLPLGLIWGLVFGFMEGRRTSEVLGAILCASFILSSGVVKSVGKALMEHQHVSPFWMPAAVGVVFMPLLAVSVLALAALPPPSPADEAERVARRPMMAGERAAFLARHWPVLVLLIAAYVLLTAFRDLRDNFAAEIWRALGYGDAASVFTASEGPVAVLSLVAMGVLIAALLLFKNFAVVDLPWLPFFTGAAYATSLAGLVLVGGSALLFLRGRRDGASST